MVLFLLACAHTDGYTAKSCFNKQKQNVVVEMKHADNGFSFSIDLIGQIKSGGCNRLLNQ